MAKIGLYSGVSFFRVLSLLDLPDMTAYTDPDYNCALCPRLCDFRAENRNAFPDQYNGPVPAFGDLSAALLIVGLAPGLRGANFSGRPFTGDYAGDVLYSALLRHGFASGTYGAHKNDGIVLQDARITNAVRCVPPQNKPTPDEVKTCRDFLIRELASMPNLSVILTLGQISHDTVMRTLTAGTDASCRDFKFGHGVVHVVKTPCVPAGVIRVVNIYHTSRYNVNTGRLTTNMVDDVFNIVKDQLDPALPRAASAK